MTHEAKIAWARYVVAIHAKLHPVFTDEYLASLCALDRGDALNDPKLTAEVELAIRADGAIANIGLISPSGQESFDAAVLQSFERIAPLPSPDPQTLSTDGHVYVRWQLTRDEHAGCAPIYAQL